MDFSNRNDPEYDNIVDRDQCVRKFITLTQKSVGCGVIRLLPYFFCADFAHNPKFDSFNSTPNYFSAVTHMLCICHFVGYPNMNGAYLF